MELSELMETLTALAGEAGLKVREVRAGADGEPPIASGVCWLRGEIWVLLVAADGLERRVDVIAGALKTHAGAILEGRYLPPAVRERLSREPEVG